MASTTVPATTVPMPPTPPASTPVPHARFRRLVVFTGRLS